MVSAAVVVGGDGDGGGDRGGDGGGDGGDSGSGSGFQENGGKGKASSFREDEQC